MLPNGGKDSGTTLYVVVVGNATSAISADFSEDLPMKAI